MRELILGGQRSGKSGCAESRAAQWLAGGASRSALLIATALPGDDEMRARIARHRADRAARVPGLATMEAPFELAAALRTAVRPQRMVVVDCLTLWLTNLLMPIEPAASVDATDAVDALVDAVREHVGPLVLVSNEIGLGVSPLSSEARRFVDEIGRLHQRVARECERVTLMVAGLETTVKGAR